MHQLVELAQGAVGLALLALGFVSLFLTASVKLPRTQRSRQGVAAVAAVAVVVVLILGVFVLVYFAPLFWGGGTSPHEDWTVSMEEDTEKTHWADPLGIGDDDFWTDAESNCGPDYTCTVSVSATRTWNGVNEATPHEVLIRFKVTRHSNDPDMPDDNDYAYPSIQFNYAHAVWVNSTSNGVDRVVYSDAYGSWFAYVEEGLSEGAQLLQSGQPKQLDGHRPSDSIDYYLGFKLNPAGFGVDGQTANVSFVTLTGEIANHDFTVKVKVVSIS